MGELPTAPARLALPCQSFSADEWFGGAESDSPTKRPRAEVNATMRQAALSCWAFCPRPARQACTSLGLTERDVLHGVWGGWLPEQRERIAHLLAVIRGEIEPKESRST